MLVSHGCQPAACLQGMVAVCQDLLLKGFTAVLSEQPLLALELAGCCKSLRDICRPHLIFENLSKLLLESWNVPVISGSAHFFCLVIPPDSQIRLARYFRPAKSYERALAVFQQHTLNLIPWDAWYAQALDTIAHALCKKHGQQCMCDPQKSAGRSSTKQLLSKQHFQEDTHAMILQVIADITTGMRSMGKWPRPRPPILHVQSIEASLYHLSLRSFVIANPRRNPKQILWMGARLNYNLEVLTR